MASVVFSLRINEIFLFFCCWVIWNATSISYCWCNKLPQIYWFKTAHIYFLLVRRSLRCWQGYTFLLETFRANVFSCLFHLLEVSIFLGLWPLSPCSTSDFIVTSPFCLTLIFLLFLYKDSCESAEHTQRIQDNLPSQDP